jgi:hypothetical protein
MSSVSYKEHPLKFVAEKLKSLPIDAKSAKEILKVVKYMLKHNSQLSKDLKETEMMLAFKNPITIHETLDRMIQAHLERNRHVPRYVYMGEETFNLFIEEAEYTIKQQDNISIFERGIKEGRFEMQHNGLPIVILRSPDVFGIAIVDRKVNTGERFPKLVN